MNKIKTELGRVERTLFMPVWARAVESKKEKPLLYDETALRIIDSVDFDFSVMSENVPEISQISWVARCLRFDKIVNDFIYRNPGGTIVNIGCGLDTSFERTEIKPDRWYDLDLPDVIALKRKFLPETSVRKYMPISFLDTEWFEEIHKNDKILFIAAGVFVYFNEDEIRNFLLKIADRFSESEMFFDVTSPKGVEIANHVIEKSGLDNRSFFKWGLKNKSIIPEWDKRISLLSSYHTFNIEGLELSSENRNIADISDSLDVQYMVHLKIN